MQTPLADRIRPKSLDEIVGQKHLIGEGKPLRRIIESGSHQELMNLNGTYAYMFNLQAEKYKDE